MAQVEMKRHRDEVEIPSPTTFYGEPFLALTVIGAYLGLAVAIYSYLVADWPIVDSVYFAIVTLTTVGYGDIGPKGPDAKIVTMCMQIVGVGVIGLALGIIADHLMSVQLERNAEFEKQRAEALCGTGSVAHSAPEPSILSKIFQAIAPILVVAFFGAAFEYFIEGWHPTDCMYWAITTVTTIGYGDHAPKYDSDKYFAVFYIPVGVSVTTYCLNKLGDIYLDYKNANTRDELLNRSLDTNYLLELDENGDGSVNKYEFFVFMLKAMDKVDDKTCKMIEQRFRALDRNQDGSVDTKDLMMGLQNAGLQTESAKSSSYGATVDF
jgi:potassium channel subfamily K